MNDKNRSIFRGITQDKPRFSIVLLGPLPIAGDVFGGAKISFSELVNEFQKRGRYEVNVINTSRPLRGVYRFSRILLNFRSLFAVLCSLWRQAGSADVIMWNVSSGGALSSGAFFWLLCKIRQRPLIIRLFGGGFGDSFCNTPFFMKWLLRLTLMRSNLVLFQTHNLVEQFANFGCVKWFPTTRDMPHRMRDFPKSCRNLLFIGQLRKEKGLHEILGASGSLSSDVVITVYGLPMDGFDLNEFKRYPQVKYMGPLDHLQVPAVLEEHDILLFPSYYEGEGYPGIVIEALQLGLPVIATHWKSIPEVVEHGKSGLIIEPRSISSLISAINKVVTDNALFRGLIDGAKRRGEIFRSKYVLDQLEVWIDQIIKK